MAVKRIVEHIRTQLKISSSELARRVGVTRQVVSHWEVADAKRINLDHLVKLRKISGLSWSAFGKMLDRDFKD